jgi:hypothetical protein
MITVDFQFSGPLRFPSAAVLVPHGCAANAQPHAGNFEGGSRPRSGPGDAIQAQRGVAHIGAADCHRQHNAQVSVKMDPTVRSPSNRTLLLRSDPFSSSDSAFAAFAGGVASINSGSSNSMADVMGSGGNGGSASGASNGESWTCAHCTFINSNVLGNCEMCSLPK